MPIEYKKNRAIFRGEVSVEEAEGLLEWLQNKSNAKVDLSACSHLHTANLQVLMTVKTCIFSWPKNADLRAWLEPALKLED
jgi:anti-anti-sigma regulatory factor